MPTKKSGAIVNTPTKSTQGDIYKTPYRVGNTKSTSKANALLKALTGLDMTSGHFTLEHAQKATETAEYYKLQQKLMTHIKKKYGQVIKDVVKIEDLRSELQRTALEGDKDIAEMIAKMAIINEKHGLDLRTLQHETKGEIGIARADTLASMNVTSANFESRLRMIARGQDAAIGNIQKTAKVKIVEEQKRQLKASTDSERRRQYNRILGETLDNPTAMPASTARTLLNKLGANLMGV